MPLTPKQQRFVGFYVYALVDPRDGAVFYVGKGTGNRWRAHERQARHDNGHNPALSTRILDILRAGSRPAVVCLAQGLTECAAFERERVEIAGRSGLCNVSPGTLSHQDRTRLRAKALIRRLKSVRDVLEPTARRYHRDILRELARLVASPDPSGLSDAVAAWPPPGLKS